MCYVQVVDILAICCKNSSEEYTMGYHWLNHFDITYLTLVNCLWCNETAIYFYHWSHIAASIEYGSMVWGFSITLVVPLPTAETLEIYRDDVIKWKQSPRLMALCAGNSPLPGKFPSQRPVTRSFGVFYHVRQSKRLIKQSRRRWFETLLRSLWRYCDVCHRLVINQHDWCFHHWPRPMSVRGGYDGSQWPWL